MYIHSRSRALERTAKLPWILQYLMQYCECDVIQLAQVFHTFRMKIFDFAKIDIVKFIGECQKSNQIN